MITPIGTIHKAAAAKKLIDCTDAELAKRLSMIYFIIGLRPQHFPSKEEDYFLFSYIRKKYATYSIDELYLAFDLAINNKLDIDEWKVYDQFSIEYLVRIMNSYRRFAAKQIQEHQPQKIENTVQITKEEKIADIENFIKQESVNIRLIPIYLFDWMVEMGYIKQSEEEKTAVYSEAIKYRYKELRDKFESNPMDQGIKREYKTFRDLMQNNFENVPDKEVSAIHRWYKILSILKTRK